MAKAIRTVLHVPMGECSIGSYPEIFGGGPACRTDFNGFTPLYLRKDEDDVNAEPATDEDLKELCARRNAYGHAIEEISMGAP